MTGWSRNGEWVALGNGNDMLVFSSMLLLIMVLSSLMEVGWVFETIGAFSLPHHYYVPITIKFGGS